MCAIIGIIGKARVTRLLVEVLRPLEYRGYDSAGVGTPMNGDIDRPRAEVKLVDLEARLADEQLRCDILRPDTRPKTPAASAAHPVLAEATP